MKPFWSRVVSKDSVLSNVVTLAPRRRGCLQQQIWPRTQSSGTLIRNSLKILPYFCLALNCARRSKVRPRYLAVMLHWEQNFL